MQFVANTARFRGQQLFGGLNIYGGGASIADVNGETVNVTLADLQRGGKLNLIDGDLAGAQSVVDAAASASARMRAAAGNDAKQAETQQRVLMVELEGLTGAKSIIEDTDYASETAKLVRAQLLQQVSMTTRQIAVDQQRESVLTLLNGIR
jgi:flagellin